MAYPPRKLDQKGLIQVYTGEGKGKTTAALGQALRACGQGWRVLIVQFMKGREESGEFKISKTIPNLTIIQAGSSSFVHPFKPSEHDVSLALEGVNLVEKALRKMSHDMIILDEINVAIQCGLIPLEKIVILLKNKPDPIEIVLTGREAHKQIIQIADLVSVVQSIKHPFQEKISARKGIEY